MKVRDVRQQVRVSRAGEDNPFVANTIYQGDALAVLRTLPDGCVQMVCTSPPYYGLRAYLPGSHPDKPAEIGLEETPESYIGRLVEVFREVRRVLRVDGVLWLNIGDSYSNEEKWGGHPSGKHTKALHTMQRPRRFTGLKPKDRIGIPWMLAFALRDDGWYLRQECIWQKSNVLPESVSDRPTTAHEQVFLFAKSRNYYYDAEAIKEKTTGTAHRGGGIRPKSALPGSGIKANSSWHAATAETVEWRNKRSVWTCPTQGYKGSHFATYPQALITPAILAGSSPQACEYCGAAWKRVIVSTGQKNRREPAHVPNNAATKTDSTGWKPTRQATDIFQPTCACVDNTGAGRCVVLDPFLGAGTTALVALQYGRHYLGIELNPAYVRLARERIATYQPRLWTRNEIGV